MPTHVTARTSLDGAADRRKRRDGSSASAAAACHIHHTTAGRACSVTEYVTPYCNSQWTSHREASSLPTDDSHGLYFCYIVIIYTFKELYEKGDVT